MVGGSARVDIGASVGVEWMAQIGFSKCLSNPLDTHHGVKLGGLIHVEDADSDLGDHWGQKVLNRVVGV